MGFIRNNIFCLNHVKVLFKLGLCGRGLSQFNLILHHKFWFLSYVHSITLASILNNFNICKQPNFKDSCKNSLLDLLTQVFGKFLTSFWNQLNFFLEINIFMDIFSGILRNVHRGICNVCFQLRLILRCKFHLIYFMVPILRIYHKYNFLHTYYLKIWTAS